MTAAAWPQNYQISQVEILEDFSNLGSFTEQGTASASAIDASTSPAGIRFSMASGDTANRYITKTNVSFDLSKDQVLGILCYVPRVDISITLGLLAYLGNDASFTTDRFSSTLGTLIVPGWNNLLIECNAPAITGQPRFGTLDGSPSFASAIQSFRLRIDGYSTAPRDFTLSAMWRGYKQRGKVLFAFDDGWATGYSAGHAYSVTKGIPLTHYVIASLLNGAQFITTAQLAEMHAAGDDVQLHGNARWDQDVTRIISDWNGLADLGYECKHAAYPEGHYGYADNSFDAVFEALQSAGINTARTVTVAQNCGYGGLVQPLGLFAVPLNSSTNLATAKLWVDRAIRVGATVIFYAHKIDSAADSLTWTTSDWQALIDYTAIKRDLGLCDCPTISDWYLGLTQPTLVAV